MRENKWVANWTARAKRLKQDVFVLYFALRHQQTPWYATALIAVVVAYAFSPIDLIPDFIPVLGYLDDLLILPLGIYLSLRMLPPQVVTECRSRASELDKRVRAGGWIAAAFIAALWVAAAALAGAWLYEWYGNLTQ